MRDRREVSVTKRGVPYWLGMLLAPGNGNPSSGDVDTDDFSHSQNVWWQSSGQVLLRCSWPSLSFKHHILTQLSSKTGNREQHGADILFTCLSLIGGGWDVGRAASRRLQQMFLHIPLVRKDTCLPLDQGLCPPC